MKHLIALAFVSLLLLASCSVEPESVRYGEDQCAYCKMTIVDQTHAAQYVTLKGKQFKFDAIECMVNELNDSEKETASKWVANYPNPGEMTAAEDARYLISEAIKSPMGANLTAFASQDQAESIKQESGGETYSWSELKAHFREK